MEEDKAQQEVPGVTSSAAPNAPSQNPPPSTAKSSYPSLGALYHESWILLKQKFWTLVKLFLLLVAVIIGYVLVIIFIALLSGLSGFINGSSAYNPGIGIGLFLSFVIYIVGGIYVTSIAQIGYIKILTSASNSSIKSTIKESIALIWPYFGTLFFSQLLVMGGLMVFFVPGLIIAVLFSFVGFVIVVENMRGKAALRRSYQLVQPHFWKIIFAIVLVQLPLIGINIIVRNASQDNPYITFVYFPFSVMAGLFIQALSVVLYNNAKRTAPTGQSVHMRWIYVCAIIGLIFMVGFIATGIYVTASNLGSLTLPDAPTK